MVMGLDFSNPVGMAAGLDKNGEHIDALAALGFGFIEIGTVTPRAQPGNPKPRLFRIPQAQAIVNRMGFNNDGIDKLMANVMRANYRGILGINIGKNFDTPMEKAVDDYLTCLRKAYRYADYIAINISSPNTPSLRQLQNAEELDHLCNIEAEPAKACGRVRKIYATCRKNRSRSRSAANRLHRGTFDETSYRRSYRDEYHYFPGWPRNTALCTRTWRIKRRAAGKTCHRRHPALA